MHAAQMQNSMTEPKLTYWLDKFGIGNDDNDIEFDREALHGKQVSPEFAAVVLLNQIDRRLRYMETILHQKFEED